MANMVLFEQIGHINHKPYHQNCGHMGIYGKGDLVCTIHIPWQTFFTINLGNVNSVLIQNAKPAPVALLSVAQKA